MKGFMMKRLLPLELLLLVVSALLLVHGVGAANRREVFVPVTHAQSHRGHPAPSATSPTPVPSSSPRPTPQPSRAPDPTPSPVRGQQCPAWVHARYTTAGPDGQQYPTWHPPTDPQYGCWFGHEHGSDPRGFPALAAVGMPAFGYVGKVAGHAEPHPGFKVFVVDDRDRGYWYLLTFHMGSGSPNRAFVQHHELDLVVARQSDRAIVANVRLLANTGGAKPKCFMTVRVHISGPVEPFKAIATDDCRNDFYESWPTQLDIPGLFRYRGAVDIDNSITAVHKNPDGSFSRTEMVYVASLMSPQCDPLAPNSDCNRLGDKRQLIGPQITLRSHSGSGTIRTDPMGRIVSSGGIVQFLAPNVAIEQSNNGNYINGVDGGDKNIYRHLRYCRDSNNCNPRNFSDGTVRPPN
jgi:hypothetical protein